MGKKLATVGDIGTAHDGFPATKITAGSPNVFINGKPAARLGDPLADHSKPKNPPHPRSITSGSSTVFINGLPAAITDSAVGCGGTLVGSSHVIIGDESPNAPSPNDISPGQLETLKKDSPFCEECEACKDGACAA